MDSKYWYRIGFVKPASRAMSSIVVDWNPRSANSDFATLQQLFSAFGVLGSVVLDHHMARG